MSQLAGIRNLFLLSFEDRDPLAARISAFGWRVSSARRGDNLITRFLAANAAVTIVDIKGAEELGLKAIAELAPLAAKGGVALLALGDEVRGQKIAQKCLEAGATHFFDRGNINGDLEAAIEFAYRYVENIGGGAEAVRNFHALISSGDLAWSFTIGNMAQHWISDQLRFHAAQVNFAQYPVTGIYRSLSVAERARVRGAFGRLSDGSAQAAIPHRFGGERVVHHLHRSADQIHGRIEYLSGDRKVDDWTDRDILTGLRNAAAARLWIKERLNQGDEIILIALGVKNFRTINAAFGRLVGDRLLRIIGQRLMQQFDDHSGEKCLVARFDGQNFLVAQIVEPDAPSPTDMAEDLLQVIFAPVMLDGEQIQMVARAGIAVSKSSTDELLLLRRAILALTEANMSDASYLKLSSATDADIVLEQELERQIGAAIDNREIVIALQPQFNVASGQLVGAEALARWEHPQYGLLGAATLFAVAERAGLLDGLSAYIHQYALAAAARWPDRLDDLRLSVNVTASDLAARDFVKNITARANAAGFSLDRLTLEITETELMGDMIDSATKLRALRAMGMRIAIDDFGTGYSSLSYLKALPLDYLKIDSGLTQDISGSSKDQVVVRSIINMAHSLNLSVIAEGVETADQLATLAAQGCEFFQGFLRAGPLPPAEFESFALDQD